MVLRLGSWLFGGRGGFVHVAELYGGLVIFMGYILFDTQVAVRASPCLSRLLCGSPHRFKVV